MRQLFLMRNRMLSAGLFLVASLLLSPMASGQNQDSDVPPPRPFLPIPTKRQLEWQRDELRLFLHFGINTFTDREWGTGEEDPVIFDPSMLDARQWARVAREAGFTTLILTAKHHDGFTLWPSRFTNHSVERSPWKNGSGDVVRELADAARAEGLKLGLYLSPWDRHEPVYGNEENYNAFYMGQLRELLSNYGTLSELWFDGAKGENAKDMEYDFDAFWSLVRQLQPGAVMFSDAGPDIRWIGNERGFAGETNWSTYDRSKVGVGMAGITAYLNTGEAGAPDWVPGECDVSIRPGWFYHPDQEPKTVDQLMDIYFKSVGRNCVLLLNVPPGPDGLFDSTDARRLLDFGKAVDVLFAENHASNATVEASSVRGNSTLYGPERVLDGSLETYWAVDQGADSGSIEFDLGVETTFNVFLLQEPVQLGQRIAKYNISVWQDGVWKSIASGTTIGHKKLDRTETTVRARRIRLSITDSLAEPLIAEFGIYYDARADRSAER